MRAGQTLVPWPNRIADGEYTFAGRTHQLALSEVPQRTAIHGLVRWANWRIAERGPDRVAMAYRLHPQPGYPFALDLRIEYALSEGGLSVRTTATNIGSEPCPYGAGPHPYLTVGTATIDPVIVRAPGTVRLLADVRGIPTGTEPVAGTDFDFTTSRMLGRIELDTAYTALDRDADGRAWVELVAPDGETAALWLDESYAFLMLFTGDALPSVSRRSLGVEPMTCAPNAFRSGDGLRTLEPEESFSACWGIASARS